MNVAVLGAGLMGRPIAERLNDMGHQVHVYNRTLEKIADLASSGIMVIDTPAAAIRAASCIVLMVTDAAAIQEILFAKRVQDELAGRTVLQMGTIGPRDSQVLQGKIESSGAEYLEAPVLGSVTEARTGGLIVMVGATQEQFAQWEDFLRCFGPEPRLIGPVSHAASLKLALNQLIVAETAAFALSLGLIVQEGVSVDTFMDVLRRSALYAATYDKKLPRLLERQYTRPNFPTKHLLKDATLFHEAALAAHLDAADLEATMSLLKKTIDKGFADGDYSAIYEVINPLSSALSRKNK